ncbi:MAG: hypothetical protein R3320_12360 [Nitriliruptorales bacterium]|nr:hypothetical protein [Nitriliruptorales bacterium]
MRAAIAILATIGWWGFVVQIVIGEPFGENPVSDLTIWVVFLLLGLLVPAVAWWLRLETTVTTDTVEARFPPFPARELAVDDIEAADLTQYRAMRDWGGYGYRRKLSGGDVAFIVSGDRGVQLELTGDERLLLGSQRPDELLAAIERARAA